MYNPSKKHKWVYHRIISVLGENGDILRVSWFYPTFPHAISLIAMESQQGPRKRTMASDP